ncbi:prepilin peptidase [Biostraticola tofi]|uniref:Prepilin leader peptidase/N-methyltransferase n=1 Tax=Biostraticola tofi TaxID=466109 RepID=A0A4R3YVL7_9GAMM|nr:A24 family peptidase [Biostraticola tofi]TCV96691.1 general secretion pathway protein O [Biostraticola tofi]
MDGVIGQAGIWALLALTGLCAGSVLNMLVYRLPIIIHRPAGSCPIINLCLPRSHCPHCRAAIRWRDNVPVCSWLLLAGRCRDCRHRISCRYPLTELACMGLTWLTAYSLPMSASWFAMLPFSWCLLALALIDLRHKLLPDALTYPLLWGGLLCNVTGLQADISLADAVIGAAAGYGSLWLVYQAFRLMTGRHALGYGDMKLTAALGAWLGWALLPQLVLTASLAGVITVLWLKTVYGRPLHRALPFGPFLALSGWVGGICLALESQM